MNKKTLKEKIYQKSSRLNFKYLSLDFRDSFLKRVEKSLNFHPQPLEVPIKNKKEKANFLFLLNSIDFSLWCYPKNWEYYGKKGYSGFQKRFYDFYKRFDLKKVKFAHFRKFISPKEDRKLAYLRYKIYLQTLNWLNKNYQGNFLNFLKKYGKDPEKFVLKLTVLPQYNDVMPKYDIYFYKKAQLLYWEMYLYGFLKNKAKIKQLTIFPDYKIISIFNYFGIIKYKPKLFDKISKGKEIKAGSREEIELRAAAVLAGEWLSKKLKKPEVELDFILWNLAYKKNLKFHKTKTIFY
jgi:hypothetical protein